MPSPRLLSRNPSLCILTGVWAVSSVRINEGWLSEEACREGAEGVPSVGWLLDLLMGREKLKAGLGRCVPPTEYSELTDGDRGMEGGIEGELGEDDMTLVEDNLRRGELCDNERSSSELSIDIDLGLGALCANGARGGAKAL